MSIRPSTTQSSMREHLSQRIGSTAATLPPARWRRALMAALVACGVTVLPLAEAVAEDRLVPARFETVTDPRDFSWDINPYGAIQTGTDNVFNGAQVLRVNGRIFSPNARQMTADGRALVLSGSVGDLAVTRRIRVMPELSSCLYLEVVENQGSEATEVTVSLLTQLRRPCQSAVTDDGAALGEQLADGQAGFALLPEGSGVTPVFIMAGRVGPRPSVRNSRNYQFTTAYESVMVPPGGRMAVVHAVAQRRDLSAGSVRSEIGPVLGMMLTGHAIDRDIRRVVTNLGGTEIRTGERSGRPRDDLRALRLVAAEAGMSRDTASHLLIGGNGLFSGEVSGESVSITVDDQMLEFPFAEVAAIAGGAGAERPHRLYLRNGNVLVGTVTAAGLSMATNQGWDLEPNVAEFEVLVLPQDAASDGVRGEAVVADLETHDGMRLALTKDDLAFELATPWGPASVPLSLIASYEYRADPRPGYEIELTDGTRLPVLPLGAELSVTSELLGERTIVQHTLRQYGTIPVSDAGPSWRGTATPPLDAELATSFSHQTDAMPLRELLALISEQSGIAISLGDGLDAVIGEQKVALTVSEYPVRDLLTDIARTFAIDVAVSDAAVALVNRPEDQQTAPLATLSLSSGHIAHGDLAVAALDLANDAGAISVAKERIAELTRDAETGRLVVTTIDDEQIVGMPIAQALNLTTAIGPLTIPMQRVMSWRLERPRPVEANP